MAGFAVATAKQQTDSTAVPGGKLDGKVILVFVCAPDIVVAAPDFQPWSPEDRLIRTAGRAAPAGSAAAKPRGLCLIWPALRLLTHMSLDSPPVVPTLAALVV